MQKFGVDKALRAGILVLTIALVGVLANTLREVVSAYHDKYLNFDVPEFAVTVSTTENLAVEMRERLLAAWPASFPALANLRVQETKRNSVELPVILEVV